MSSHRMLSQPTSILVLLSGWIFERGVVNGNDTNVFFVTYETTFWRAPVTLSLQKSI